MKPELPPSVSTSSKDFLAEIDAMLVQMRVSMDATRQHLREIGTRLGVPLEK